MGRTKKTHSVKSSCFGDSWSAAECNSRRMGEHSPLHCRLKLSPIHNTIIPFLQSIKFQNKLTNAPVASCEVLICGFSMVIFLLQYVSMTSLAVSRASRFCFVSRFNFLQVVTTTNAATMNDPPKTAIKTLGYVTGPELTSSDSSEDGCAIL